MKLYKIYFFITIIFMGLYAFDIANAIRIDFLEKSTSLQPVPFNTSPNLSGDMDFRTGQTNRPDSGTNPLSVILTGKNSAIKNGTNAGEIFSLRNIFWLIIFLMVLAVVFIYLKPNKKKIR